LSLSETNATESGAVLGTLGYMAPEQALGLAVDERADIFAVGGVLYRMLAGVTPTQAENVGDLMRILAHGTIAPLSSRAPGLPPPLDAAVTRALAHDPGARFPDAGSFALALAASIGLASPGWVTNTPRGASMISASEPTRTSELPRGSAPTH